MATRISLEQFSRVVSMIHEAGAAPELWAEALAGVMGLLEGSRVSLMDIEAGGDRLLAMNHVGHDATVARIYAAHYFAIDPTRLTSLAAPAYQAMTVFEAFPRAVRDRHEYFDFARACDIGDVVGVSTAETGGQRSLLSLQRRVGGKPYDADEKRLLELLAPHIHAAKRVQTTLGASLQGKAELDAVFDRLAMPAFVVDSRGAIRHLNAAAGQLMGSARHVVSRRGKLAFADPKLAAAFQSAVAAAAQEGGRSSALPLQLGARERVEVLVSPLQARHRLVTAWGAPLALVVITSSEKDEQAIRWRLQQLYGLTPAEARLAAALAAGATLEQVAAARRVTAATLRSQLRSIFSKTGTSRQADLVRIALRGAALR